ncbi:MAG: PIN domain-containing protein [Planctomycetes bacterium]|nr:PIN domain-containing protein [Planctomycetota bacterium]
MDRKPRVYLETSFVSACVTTKTDPASRDQRWHSLRWWHSRAEPGSLFVSNVVRVELARQEYRSRWEALRWIEGLGHVDGTSEVERLAAELVRDRLMPGGDSMDAFHAALAIWHGMDALLTWDQKHLANPRKTWRMELVARRWSSQLPRFVTPKSWSSPCP